MIYEFKVNMLTGEYGKKEIIENISAISGVDSVEVELGNGQVKVDCSEEIGLDVFAMAVEEAGYKFVWNSEGK